MNPASALTRYATSEAISSDVPKRPSAFAARWPSANGPSAGLRSVSTAPGWITFTVMPRGPSSRASGLVSPTRADLLSP
ncbi:hypothetical protein SGRI78S_01501 [Streptomyces griseus subsp. griseus]